MDKDFITINDTKIRKDLSFIVVEDNTILNDLISEMLIDFGFTGKFYSTTNLKDTIKILDQEEIQFIISDWGLPDGEGINLLSAIRKSPKYSKIPFMMITGKNDIESMVRASELKTSEYLVKPFSKEELLEKIESCFNDED